MVETPGGLRRLEIVPFILPCHRVPRSAIWSSFSENGRLGPDLVRDRFTFINRRKPEPSLCFVGIVRAAAQLQVRRSRLSAVSEGDDVVEFQETTLLAPPIGAFECAPAAVTGSDFTLHRRGPVSRVRDRSAGRRGPADDRELAALEVRDEDRQRALDHQRRIAVRNRVPQQFLRATQVFVRLAGNRDAHAVALGCERGDRGRFRWR